MGADPALKLLENRSRTAVVFEERGPLTHKCYRLALYSSVDFAERKAELLQHRLARREILPEIEDVFFYSSAEGVSPIYYLESEELPGKSARLPDWLVDRAREAGLVQSDVDVLALEAEVGCHFMPRKKLFFAFLSGGPEHLCFLDAAAAAVRTTAKLSRMRACPQQMVTVIFRYDDQLHSTYPEEREGTFKDLTGPRVLAKMLDRVEAEKTARARCAPSCELDAAREEAAAMEVRRDACVEELLEYSKARELSDERALRLLAQLNDCTGVLIPGHVSVRLKRQQVKKMLKAFRRAGYRPLEKPGSKGLFSRKRKPPKDPDKRWIAYQLHCISRLRRPDWRFGFPAE